MEQYKESKQNVLDIKHQNVLAEFEKPILQSPTAVRKPGSAASQYLEATIVSATPEKTCEPVHTKHKEEAVELPQKYRILAELFDRMTCSLRLLSLRNKSTTFQNIRRQVEMLVGRELSYKHLGQIKYILPEAVQTEKILIYDEKTLCMKPDIRVILVFDVIKDHLELSTFTALHKLFASRLLSFFSKHPEGCEIPEALLPELFNQRSDAITTGILPIESQKESQPNFFGTDLSLNSSHLYPSFIRHFSQTTDDEETEKHKKSQPVESPVPHLSTGCECVTNQYMGSGKQISSPDESSKSTVIANPVQQSYPQLHVSSSARESTPVKLVSSEAGSLGVETPAQLTPKRSMPSCDNKIRTVTCKKWATCNLSTKRSLDFSHLECEEVSLNSTQDEVDQCKAVPDTILQTPERQGIFLEENVTYPTALLQKVEESNGCTPKEQKTNQTGLIMDLQMSPCLSDLVPLIHHQFQSGSCFSITKEELVHKIIINNCEIVDRKEVEDHLELLEKMVPDWICRTLAPSGDVLYNIRKVSNLNSIRERLICMRHKGD